MTSGLRYSNSDLMADFVDYSDCCSNVTNQVGYLFRKSLGDLGDNLTTLLSTIY